MNPYQYINNLNKYGSEGGFKPGLERINALLEPFGHPEQNLAVIHVAGSNGKGSTISFLKSIYQEAGYKVGTYISPHLVKFNERIEINGRHIKTEELSQLVKMIKPVVEKVSKDKKLGKPSFFEVVTALALLYFSQEEVDLLILEVGLGGRYDATNIIEKPLVSLITSISLEHTEILGNTIEEIAREKAGIIKKDRPVITGVKKEKALQVIKEVAEENKSKLSVIPDKYKYKIINSDYTGQKVYIKRNDNREAPGEEYFIRLTGEHQVWNASLAIETVNELNDTYPVKKEEIKQGLKKAYIPGRLEVIKESPVVILDGAHNLEGMGILTDFLKKHLRNDQKIYIILGVFQDKDIKGMLSLFNFSDQIELILTKNTSERAASPDYLKRIADSLNLNNRVYPFLKDAIKTTFQLASSKDLICITGSIYTVADAKIIMERY